MKSIDLATAEVAAEVAAVGKGTDPEWIAGYAMCYVHPRLRSWKERERYIASGTFTPAGEMLESGSGLCGSTIIVWREILHRLGIQTRQLSLTWKIDTEPYDVGHACGETYWDDGWHFFDVMNGAVWLDADKVLSWDELRLEPNARRVSNDSFARYSAFDEWVRADPFAYVSADLQVQYVYELTEFV